jgi:hypothetical protein
MQASFFLRFGIAWNSRRFLRFRPEQAVMLLRKLAGIAGREWSSSDPE